MATKKISAPAEPEQPVEIKVRLRFIEPVLGTTPGNPNIFSEFIASNAPTLEKMEEEIAEFRTASDEIEKLMTVYPRLEDGAPYFYDYQVKGFFKDACGALRKVRGTYSSQIAGYKKEIDNLIFPMPRRIPLKFEGEVTKNERSIRCSTPQGERTALASAEQLPVGTTCEFSVVMLSQDCENRVREWLNYGRLKGIGQWRNGGFGRFLWSELDADGNVIGGNA